MSALRVSDQVSDQVGDLAKEIEGRVRSIEHLYTFSMRGGMHNCNTVKRTRTS